MNEPTRSSVVLDDDARHFLKRTGVLVLVVEALVLTSIWFFQFWFGR
jgi:hypothetical protein